MGSFKSSIDGRLNDTEQTKEIIEIGEGRARENPLSEKSKILEIMKQRERERAKLYGTEQKGFEALDLRNMDTSDESKKDMLKNQLNTMYKEIQYMQDKGLWRELKEVREMFTKALKLFFDEEYRQKDDMGSGQLQYNQLKSFVNKLLQFVVGWNCVECNIRDSVEVLIEELSKYADIGDQTID